MRFFPPPTRGCCRWRRFAIPAGQPFDFQIVHHNQGASRLLKVPSTGLLWRRLSAGGNLLCSPEVLERLFAVIKSGNRDQFEIDSDDRNLKLGATAFGDILSLTVSDVTTLRRREASFRLLFDNNPMPMWVFDAETTGFLSVNDAAVQHYGYSRATFLRMKLQEIWPRTNGYPIPRRCSRSATPIIPTATGGTSRPTAARFMC
jgi:PAS domain-containing protein